MEQHILQALAHALKKAEKGNGDGHVSRPRISQIPGVQQPDGFTEGVDDGIPKSVVPGRRGTNVFATGSEKEVRTDEELTWCVSGQLGFG